MPTTYDSKFHIDNIVEKYGNELDADMVKAYCDANPIGYQTITKFLNKYKTKRGHWNVTVSQAKAKLEQTFRFFSVAFFLVFFSLRFPFRNEKAENAKVFLYSFAIPCGRERRQGCNLQ